MNVEGRRALVTGAGRGLGRSLAIALARAGCAEVVATARDAASLAGLEAEVGAPLRAAALDVADGESVRRAAEGLGRMDLVLNNAGTAVLGGSLKGAWTDVEREVAVNYLGPLRVARAFAPAMIEHGDGLIVNVASQLARINLPALGTYCATKAALVSITQVLRFDLAPHGVRAIAVLPGTLDTDMSRGFDVPKLSPDDAAEEILAAIRDEAPETPIGDEARGLFAELVRDPRAVERRFAELRA